MVLCRKTCSKSMILSSMTSEHMEHDRIRSFFENYLLSRQIVLKKAANPQVLRLWERIGVETCPFLRLQSKNVSNHTLRLLDVHNTSHNCMNYAIIYIVRKR